MKGKILTATFSLVTPLHASFLRGWAKLSLHRAHIIHTLSALSEWVTRSHLQVLPRKGRPARSACVEAWLTCDLALPFQLSYFCFTSFLLVKESDCRNQSSSVSHQLSSDRKKWSQHGNCSIWQPTLPCWKYWSFSWVQNSYWKKSYVTLCKC